MVAGVFWLGSLYVSVWPNIKRILEISNILSPPSCVVASIVRLYYFALLSKLAETDRQFSSIHCDSSFFNLY